MEIVSRDFIRVDNLIKAGYLEYQIALLMLGQYATMLAGRRSVNRCIRLIQESLDYLQSILDWEAQLAQS